jgi:hypothetical protein
MKVKIKGSAISSTWAPSQFPYKLSLANERISSKNQFGIRLRLAYELKVSKSVFVSPQYHLYLGSQEFSKYTAKIKSV